MYVDEQVDMVGYAVHTQQKAFLIFEDAEYICIELSFMLFCDSGFTMFCCEDDVVE